MADLINFEFDQSFIVCLLYGRRFPRCCSIVPVSSSHTMAACPFCLPDPPRGVVDLDAVKVKRVLWKLRRKLVNVCAKISMRSKSSTLTRRPAALSWEGQDGWRRGMNGHCGMQCTLTVPLTIRKCHHLMKTDVALCEGVWRKMCSNCVRVVFGLRSYHICLPLQNGKASVLVFVLRVGCLLSLVLSFHVASRSA